MRREIRRNHRQIRPSATDTLHNHVLSIMQSDILRCTAKHRIRRRRAEDRPENRTRLHLRQARRPVLPPADPGNPRRGGRRERPTAHLVPPEAAAALRTRTMWPRREAGPADVGSEDRGGRARRDLIFVRQDRQDCRIDRRSCLSHSIVSRFQGGRTCYRQRAAKRWLSRRRLATATCHTSREWPRHPSGCW